MFFGSFAWSFVFVSLPFHIQRVSTLDPTATLRWTGWIVGITSLVTVLTAPIWGRYAARGNPKACYVAVEALQGLGFFVMALAPPCPSSSSLGSSSALWARHRRSASSWWDEGQRARRCAAGWPLCSRR
jgi:MFS family permease